METSNPGGGLVVGVPVGSPTPITSIQVNSAADTDTTGIRTINKVQTTVTPSGPSTHTSVGQEYSQQFTGTQPQNSGGYANCLLAGQIINTTQSVDKHVVSFAKTDYTSATATNFGINFESAVTSINAGATVALFAHYLVLNHSGVPNYTTRITQRFGFLCQDVNTPSMLDRIIDPDYNEICPQLDIGLQSGQLYSANISAYNSTAVAPNKVYITFVHVPQRATIATIGMEVLGAVAGNCRLGMYKVGGGQLGALIGQGTFSTGTIGFKPVTLSTQVNAGTYALVALFDAAPTVRYHNTPVDNSRILGRSAIGNVQEEASISMAYGVLPGTFAGTPLTRSANGIEIDIVYIPA